jgi:glycolate oxidase
MCSLGGNVAENAGGPRAFKYGVTREYVIGLEVVLVGGEVLRPGRRTAKGVTGYDVVALFVGSEGTFGVTTEVTIKLLPLPAAVGTILAAFRDVHAAGRAVTGLLRAGQRPRALELIDGTALAHVRGKTPYRFPEGAGAAVLCEVDGEPEAIEPQMLRCADVCEQFGGLEILVAKDDRERRDLWAARRLISPSLREAHRVKVSEDIAVPRGVLPRMIERVFEIGHETRLMTASYGHAGDGNLHVNVLSDEERTPAVAERIEQACAAIFRSTLDLRGTLSGEHGIGLAKQRFLEWEQPPALIGFQEKLKRAIDPLNLLNPGKFLPTGHRE